MMEELLCTLYSELRFLGRLLVYNVLELDCQVWCLHSGYPGQSNEWACWGEREGRILIGRSYMYCVLPRA